MTLPNAMGNFELMCSGVFGVPGTVLQVVESVPCLHANKLVCTLSPNFVIFTGEQALPLGLHGSGTDWCDRNKFAALVYFLEKNVTPMRQ